MANIRVGRKSGFIVRGGARRRETLWFAGSYIESLFTSGGISILISGLSAAALALRPFTVIRSRGYLSVQPDQTAATESQLCGYGACVVSDQSVAVGAGSVPTPVTDSGSDLWFLYEPFLQEFQFQSAVGSGGVGRMGMERTLDSRAMRKVEDGQDIITVGETDSASDGLVMRSFLRLLVKLH